MNHIGLEKKKHSGKWYKKSCGNLFPGILLILAIVLGIISVACQKSHDMAFLKIGLPEEPKSLNLWLATDANTRKILTLIYQPLYHHHPETSEIIPWLAEGDPVYDPEKLTYTIRLRTARWSDGSKFTSDDVQFTMQMFMDFKIPRHYNNWQVIDRLEAPDEQTLVFHLKEPSAIFTARVLTASIVSRKEWESVAQEALTREKPLRSLQDHIVTHPLGTGPFLLHEYQKGAYIHMKKNPYFFGEGQQIGGYELGPHVENILFNIYGTSDVAILALKKKDIDFYWWDIQPGYIEDLEKMSEVDVFLNKKSALYYLGFNLRISPFDDKVLRQAVATIVDKEFILTRILQNHGDPMHSLVPEGNRFWYNPHVRQYGQGMDRDQRIRAAFGMLRDAGYTWENPPVREDGSIAEPSDIILPSGEKMRKIVILTPPADYDPKRAFAGTMIQEWLRSLGLPTFSRPMAFNSLLETVKGKHDFDAFVLGYGKLDTDPDYLGTFFESANNVPRGWNMSGYTNPEFDRLAQSQRLETDMEKRREMIWQMQEMLLEDLPYLPLYNPHIIEAVLNERFTGWVQRVDGIGNIWSLCLLKPIP